MEWGVSKIIMVMEAWRFACNLNPWPFLLGLDQESG